MKKSVVINKKRNYGLLTDASKTINEALGDKTGRTVSMRTAHGFKNTFNLNETIDDNTAEDIVHTGMLASAALLTNKSDGAKIVGALLLLGLIGCYQNGK